MSIEIHPDNCKCANCTLLPIVNCEQEHCRGQGKDEQFYCAAHGLELCSICRFTHPDCEAQGLLLRGSRKDNDGIIIPLESTN